jgi:hypothetical protein
MHACKGVQGSSVFETKSRDTPINFTHAHRGDQTYLQGSEFKNFAAMNWTDPDYAASGIDESNHLFSESVKPFPVSQHQIPCSANINSLFSSKAFPAFPFREYQRKFLNLTRD